MPIAGELAKIPLVKVLEMLQAQARAGLLTIQTEGKETTLYFNKDGVRLFSVNGQKAMRIGDILLEHERITEFQLKHALERQAQNKRRLGEILVELGLVSGEEIEQAIKSQAEEEIFEIFSLKDGQFRFAERELVEAEYRPDPTSPDHVFPVDQLVNHIAKRVEEWQRLAGEFRGDGDIFTVAPDKRAGIIANAPEAARRRLAELLNGENTIGDLVHRMLLPRYKIYRALAEMVRDGQARRASSAELLAIANRLREDKRVKQAVKLLEQAFATAPQDTGVAQALAEIYETVGDKKRAGSYYKVLADIHFNGGQAEQGALLCAKVAEFLPADPYPHERLVEHYLARDLRDRALDSARTLLRLYQQAGDLVKATELCASFLEMFRDDIGLHERMVNLHLAGDRKREAVSEYEAMADLIGKDARREPAARDRERLEIFQKILLIDKSREDIRKQVEVLTGTTDQVAQERRQVRGRLLIVVGGVLAVLLAAGGLYEWRGRSAFTEAREEADILHKVGNLDDAIRLLNDALAAWGLCTAAGSARAQRDQLVVERTERDRLEQERVKQRDELLDRVKHQMDQGDLESAEALARTVQAADVGGPQGRRAGDLLRQIGVLRDQARDRQVEAGLTEAEALEKVGDRPSLARALELLRALPESKNALLRRRVEEGTGRSRKRFGDLMFQQAEELQRAAGRADDNGDYLAARDAYVNALAVLRQPEVAGRDGLPRLEASLKGRLASLENYLQGGDQLLTLAREAEAAERYDEAVAVLGRLLSDYSNHPEVRGNRVTLPLRLTSEPSGARVLSGEAEVGRTPVVLRYVPKAGTKFRVERPGYESVTLAADGTRGHSVAKLVKIWLWRVALDGAVSAAPLLLDRRLVVGGRARLLRAFDLAADPATPPPAAWSYDLDLLGEARATPAPLGADLLVVPSSNNRRCHALDVGTGQRRWSVALPVEPEGPALTAGPTDAVVVCLRGGRMLGLDPASGATQWDKTLPAPAAVTAARTAAGVFVRTTDGALHCVDPATGTVRWRLPVGGASGGDLATFEGRLVVPVADRCWLLTADATDPTARREYVGARADIRGVAVVGDRLYATTTIATVCCWSLDAPDAPLWQVQVTGNGPSPPRVQGDQVVVGMRTGHCVALAAADGAARWSVKLPDAIEAAPVPAPGVLLVPCEDGKLYAIEP